MKVIGFSGTSGSGKSYRALEVAASRRIKYIIDDGLLISGNRVVAGRSAKKESTRLASVRCALFFDSAHASAVKAAISREKPETIMILGTSHEMIEKIAKALGLPPVSEFIEITDIASDEEIAAAKQVRSEEGMHVIPVPTFEVKKDFSGYWLDTLRWLTSDSDEKEAPEKTVVRPTFSYLGDFEIANSVLSQICKYETELCEGVAKCTGCTVSPVTGGVDIRIDVIAKYGVKLPELANRITRRTVKAIDFSTSINVHKVTVYYKSLEI